MCDVINAMETYRSNNRERSSKGQQGKHQSGSVSLSMQAKVQAAVSAILLVLSCLLIYLFLFVLLLYLRPLKLYINWYFFLNLRTIHIWCVIIYAHRVTEHSNRLQHPWNNVTKPAVRGNWRLLLGYVHRIRFSARQSQGDHITHWALEFKTVSRESSLLVLVCGLFFVASDHCYWCCF